MRDLCLLVLGSVVAAPVCRILFGIAGRITRTPHHRRVSRIAGLVGAVSGAAAVLGPYSRLPLPWAEDYLALWVVAAITVGASAGVLLSVVFGWLYRKAVVRVPTALAGALRREGMTRWPPQFSVRALLLLARVVAIAFKCWTWMRGHPCSLPARRDIAAMKVTHGFYDFVGNRAIQAFEIPEPHWDAVLAALTPCEPDPNPAGWVCLCDLDIDARGNRHYHVMLFWLQGAKAGAFRVSLDGHIPESTYYRGGDSVQLRNAILAAYAESLRPLTQNLRQGVLCPWQTKRRSGTFQHGGVLLANEETWVTPFSPSTPPSSTALVHNFREYLPSRSFWSQLSLDRNR
jgi:hypothetical protein